MSGPLVTLGVPVFRGEDMLPITLECLRTQTYPNLDILISVDNADRASIEASKPFLQDHRFRMHVQPTRLGWAGNTDWTMHNRRGEFFIYQQHDDQISHTYVADLVHASRRFPEASICYAEMVTSGADEPAVRSRELLGEPLQRTLAHLERMDSSMLRGLIRGAALDRTAGLLLSDSDPFDSYGTEHRFMTELALAGEFRFVEGPLYFKRMHGKNMQLARLEWTEERKRAAWSCLAAWMIEVIVPVGSSIEQRWRLLETVLDRFLVSRGSLSWLRRPSRWLYRGGDPGRVLLRAVVDRVRRSGGLDDAVRANSRWFLCRVDTPVVRAALLHEILTQLRAGGRFDVAVSLAIDWQALKEKMARHFGLQHPEEGDAGYTPR